MLVLVNYHMDTLSGIGYRSEHTWWISMYTGGYLYGERRIHTLSIDYRVYAWCGDYLSICRCTILDDFDMND